MQSFKLFFISGIIAFGATMASCERCATCTSPSDDPLSETDTLVAEFCDKGHRYNDQLETYERMEWSCEED